MTQREKQELIPTLKVNVDKDDDLSVALTEEMQVSILEVKDINTKHGLKTIAIVENNDGKKLQVFLNSTSLNSLIDAFGNDDKNFIGSICNLKVENAPEPYEKTKMIVFHPVK